MYLDNETQLQEIIEEYKSRERNKNKPNPIGALWHNPTNGKTYICNGFIKGKPSWSEVSSNIL